MSHEATLIYSESLLREAVFGFWRRSVGMGFILMLVALPVILGVLVALGAPFWLIVTLAVLLVLAAAVAVALYVGYYRNSLRKFRTMEHASSDVPRRRVLVHHEFGRRHDDASVVRRQGAVAVP